MMPLPPELRESEAVRLTPAKHASRVLAWQFVWLLAGSVLALLLVNRRAAWSMLAGSGIGLLGIAYVMLVMVKHSVQITRPATLFSVLITWLIKTILVVGLLLIALRSPVLTPLAIMLGLMGSFFVYWLCLFVGRVKHANRNDGK